MNGVDTWISGASAVVALAALGLTVWEGMANRRHNRLSVSPRLRVDFDVHPENRSVRIILVNAGLGPAIFDSLEPMVDRQPVAGLGLSGMGEAAVHAGLTGKLRYATVLKDEVLTHGSSLDLLSVLEEVFDERPDQEYEPAFRRLGVRVRYHSMYDEPLSCEGYGDEFLGRDEAPVPPPGKVAVPALTGAPAA